MAQELKLCFQQLHEFNIVTARNNPSKLRQKNLHLKNLNLHLKKFKLLKMCSGLIV